MRLHYNFSHKNRINSLKGQQPQKTSKVTYLYKDDTKDDNDALMICCYNARHSDQGTKERFGPVFFFLFLNCSAFGKRIQFALKKLSRMLNKIN